MSVATRTFYNDFIVECFNLRWKKGEGFHHIFLFQKNSVFRMEYPTKRLYEIPF
jgi:hypothetical protein